MSIRPPPKPIRALVAEAWRRAEPARAARHRPHHALPAQTREDFAEQLLASIHASGDSAAEDALDVVHTPGGGRRVTLRSVMEAGRAVGMWTEVPDDWFRALAERVIAARGGARAEAAARLGSLRSGPRDGALDLGALAAARRHAKPALADHGGPLLQALHVDWEDTTVTSGPPESAWRTSALPKEMGVAQFEAATGLGGNGKVDPADVYGTYVEAMVDIASMGGGIVRRFRQCDLTWWALCPGSDMRTGEPLGAEIPAPLDILDTLAPDQVAVWERFDALVLVSVMTGVRLSPTLFEDGGGGPVNESSATKATIPGTDVAYADLKPAGEGRYSNLIIPASKGWSAFYHDESGFPSTCTVANSYEDQTLDEAVSAPAFAQFVLDVYDLQADTYLAESARRKALGVAAFGEAIATKLLCWEAVLRGQRIHLEEVIADLEVSNEIDYFYSSGTVGADAYAMFLVYLMGPLVTTGPRLPIRAGELTSWVPDVSAVPDPDPWGTACSFAAAVLHSIQETCSVLQSFQSNAAAALLVVLFDPDPEDWSPDQTELWRVNTILQAGYAFPNASSTLTPSAYVHQVGYHVFHAWDANLDGTTPSTYRSTQELAADAQVFIDTVVTYGLGLGYSLAWTASAIGFMAERPDSPSGNDYTNASPELQAGMLIRYLLLLRASGAASVSWFTYMDPIEDFASPDSGGEYGSMGVRQDVARPGAGTFADGRWYAESTGAFRYANNAYRRPAWFAFQRLAALLSYASGYEVLENNGGATVIRFRITGLDPASTFEGFGGGSTYTYAYVFWLDQASTLTTTTYSLTGVLGAAAELPLVPALTYTRPPYGGTVANCETLSWPLLAWAQPREPDPSTVDVQISRAGSTDGDPPGEPRPFCLLVNQVPDPSATPDTSGGFSGTYSDAAVVP